MMSPEPMSPEPAPEPGIGMPKTGRLRLLLAGGLALASVAGCGRRAVNSEYYVRMWLSMRHSPLEVIAWEQDAREMADFEKDFFGEGHAGLWQTPDGERACDPDDGDAAGDAGERGLFPRGSFDLPDKYETPLGPSFRTREAYGPYQVLRGPGMALLLDKSGRPLWAGEWALPCRIRNKVESLLLLSAGSYQTSTNGGEVSVLRLYFGSDTPGLELLGFPSYHPSLAYAFDIDGDGTDEMLLVEHTKCPHGAEVTFRIASLDLRPERYRTHSVIPELAPPKPRDPARHMETFDVFTLSGADADAYVKWRLVDSPTRELRFQIERRGDDESTPARMETLGTLSRQPNTAKWVFAEKMP